jgi:hypothetical protein
MAPVTEANRHVELAGAGFAIELPEGDHWCINTGAGLAGVVFGKNSFGERTLDRPPAMAERAHTFGGMAVVVEIQGAKIENPQDLHAFLVQWRRAGEPGKMDGGRIVLLATPAPSASAFTVVSSTLEAVMLQDIECVRLNDTKEERNNRGMPGRVLVLVNRTWYCRHPRSGQLVMVGYSERYLQGNEPQPLLMEILKDEIEPFVRSLRLTQPR